MSVWTLDNGVFKIGDITTQFFKPEWAQNGTHLGTYLLTSSIFLGPIVSFLWKVLNGQERDKSANSLSDELRYQAFYTILTHPYYVVMIHKAKHDIGTISAFMRVYEIGLDAFFTGIFPRMCGTLLFSIMLAVINKITGLPKATAQTTMIGVLMVIRDVSIISLLSPLYASAANQITILDLS